MSGYAIRRSGYRIRASESINKRNRTNEAVSVIPNTDYLMHAGILGMKWGVRRYQNEDGTLTEEGKARYRKQPESETWKKSDAEHLSDEELRRRTNRLQAEQNYKNLTTTEVERERKALSKEFKKDVLKKLLILPVLAVLGIAGRKYITKGADFIAQFAKKKFAPYKAASMLKNTLKNANVPNQTYNPFANLGKHVGKIGKNMISKPGPKIYEKGVYANPLLKNRAYWRGLGSV